MLAYRCVWVHIVAGATASYSHAIASLAAVLLREGPPCEDMRVFTVRTRDVSGIARSIAQDEPDIVLVSSTTNQWFRANELASTIKHQSPRSVLCAGGAHVTYCTDLERGSAFDILVPGEAEGVIAPVIHYALRDVSQAIAYVRRMGPNAGAPAHLDALPMPAFGLFPVADITPYPSVMLSRGCPYGCTYCASRRGGSAKSVRWKSPQRAIGEIAELAALADIGVLYIDDDCFLKSPRWVTAFCSAYGETLSIPFYCNTRPEDMTRDLAQALKSSNCAGVGIGLESGSERIRADVLGRSMTNQQIRAAFDTARRAGLTTWSFNMVGIPSERAEDFEATIRLNDEIAPDFIRLSIFTPYPGAPLCKENAGRTMAQPYIRTSEHLPDNLRELYCEWLNRLHSQGKLWYTEAELGQALGDRQ